MAKKAAELDVDVAFAGVSIGDKTCRLGFTIDRSNMAIDEADEFFSSRRLTGEFILGHYQAEAAAGQKKLFEAELHLAGTFDVKGFGVSEKSFSTGAVFPISETDLGTLGKFAKRIGKLVVNKSSDLPKAADAVAHDGDTGEKD